MGRKYPGFFLWLLAAAPLSAWAATESVSPPSASTSNAYDSQGSTTHYGELARKSANPLGYDLATVSLQNAIDLNLGAANGTRYTLDLEPTYPTKISSGLDLITHLDFPIVSQSGVTYGRGVETGLGDTTLSFYLSPHSGRGNVFGLGPVLYIPTATNTALGRGKWGAGPAAGVIIQNGNFTYGVVANQIWSYAGDSSRPDLNRAGLQPFMTISRRTGVNLTVRKEDFYYWDTKSYLGSVVLEGTRVVGLDTQMASFGGGVVLYHSRPQYAPSWGLRINISFLFPR